MAWCRTGSAGLVYRLMKVALGFLCTCSADSKASFRHKRSCHLWVSREKAESTVYYNSRGWYREAALLLLQHPRTSNGWGGSRGPCTG